MCTISYEGIVYPSTEHAYQAAKAFPNDTYNKQHIASLQKPAAAMHWGRSLEKQGKQRVDWHLIKKNVMFDVLWIKFQIPELRQKIIATGDCALVEGNTWGDIFWGECPIGNGENNLGKTLMAIRRVLIVNDE